MSLGHEFSDHPHQEMLLISVQEKKNILSFLCGSEACFFMIAISCLDEQYQILIYNLSPAFLFNLISLGLRLEWLQYSSEIQTDLQISRTFGKNNFKEC